MRVLVIGGYGLIGSYVVARLHADGHTVIGLGRDVAAAARRAPFAQWIAGDLARMNEADWGQALTGVDAVVNCAGALQEGPRDNLQAVHVSAASALYAACAAAGVRRVVLVSAAGVAPGRGTAFTDTKALGEQQLMVTDLDWVILRPGLVLAPAAYGGTALLRGLAAFPLVVPAANPAAIVQVVSVEDVATAAARAVRPDAPARISLDLVHADRTSLGEVLLALRAWLGLPPAPLAPIAPGLVPRLADALAWLGWRSPMRTTAMKLLSRGVTGEQSPELERLGISLKSPDQMLAGWPSGVQERWFARLYFLKPAALFSLIAFWLVSGVVGMTAGFEQAAAVLTTAHMTPDVARWCVIAGSLADITLAALACFRASASLALKGMALASLAYLACGSILRPDLWLDPLGPYAKIVPTLLLALTTLAVMDER